MSFVVGVIRWGKGKGFQRFVDVGLGTVCLVRLASVEIEDILSVYQFVCLSICLSKNILKY